MFGRKRYNLRPGMRCTGDGDSDTADHLVLAISPVPEMLYEPTGKIVRGFRMQLRAPDGTQFWTDPLVDNACL